MVSKFYSERNTPLPGALVKAQMVAGAKEIGSEFSERALGFRKFIDFIRSVPEVAIQGRSGSDILLAPGTAGELLAAYASPLPRLRRDFWRAFIEFPVPNVIRLYDPDEDKVLHVESGTQRPGIQIEPAGRDEQVEWRRTFAEEQPEPIKDHLLASLSTPGTAMFNEFARRLREHPSVMRAWNRYLQKQITDRVATWAAKHGVADERWIASVRFTQLDGEIVPAKPQNISQRAELYNFFDQLPVDDLLELRVPLDWVLRVIRRGDV
ncbi:MAG: OST-HTH/LOTUS domain-containing protein [Bryobacteraceae bacterium]